ncbi:MAG: molybdopterin molybdotransferase MoeA [Desulfobacteraceae bacterium]|jgi:molybdopterin molybdotransferase
MLRSLPLGLNDALKLTLERIQPLKTIHVDLLEGLDQALAEDMPAMVDSPSIHASLKDGYAVISKEVEGATREHPVRLKLTGRMVAGGSRNIRVLPQTAVRVLTGAKIPSGADAVVSEEFTSLGQEETLTIYKNAEPGRNILPKGSDVAMGRVVAAKGTCVTPGLAGILAAAGYSRIPVVCRPKVAVISTGDEVVAPGQPLPEGKLYASNMTTLGGWCRRYGMQTHLDVVKDDEDSIHRILEAQIDSSDAVITSGGAWTGDRDLVAQILNRLGWRQVFHRIRIGPGKAVGFGLLKDKPVFILPGGPPSNLMGFLQIALPGLLKLAGYRHAGLPIINVQLATELKGRFADWTQFFYGTIEKSSSIPIFNALKDKSRLRSMAEAQAVVAIAEGETVLTAGTIVAAQLLDL